MTSIVGCADTFPKGESKYLYRRQCRHFPRKGKRETGMQSFFYKLRKMFDCVWFFADYFSLNDERCG